MVYVGMWIRMVRACLANILLVTLLRQTGIYTYNRIRDTNNAVNYLEVLAIKEKPKLFITVAVKYENC